MAKTKTARVPNGAPSCKWRENKGVYEASQANPNRARDGVRRLYAYSTTYDDALEKLRVMVERARAGMPAVTGTQTVADWVDHWLENIAKRNLTPKTYRGHKSIIDSHVKPLIGHIKLRNLTADDLNDMYDKIVVRIREDSKGRYDGIGSARLAHRILHTALRAAYRRDEVARNVAEHAEPPSASKEARRAMTADQAKHLLRVSYQNEHPYTSALAVLLFTGVRLGEVLGLTWDRVHLPESADGTGGFIDVTWQLQSHTKNHGCGNQREDKSWPCGRKRGAVCPSGFFDFPLDYEHKHLVDSLHLTRPKSGASIRKLPVTPQLAAFLMLQAQKTRNRVDNEHNLVFTDPRYPFARPLPPRTAWQMFKECVAAAGLPEDLVVHETRHTTVTLLHEAGVDAETIQMIVGHASIATTRIYTHIGQNVAAAALRNLDNFLGIDMAA
ncbi:tyrosine recombinase XerC [Nocardia sp. NPDC127526]|uniref:site-specific integrase n=1 Tax=Nocardia sp. NPDC127526 TaxID=3345393 RepID=UPI003628D2E2